MKNKLINKKIELTKNNIIISSRLADIFKFFTVALAIAGILFSTLISFVSSVIFLGHTMKYTALAAFLISTGKLWASWLCIGSIFMVLFAIICLLLKYKLKYMSKKRKR